MPNSTNASIPVGPTPEDVSAPSVSASPDRAPLRPFGQPGTHVLEHLRVLYRRRWPALAAFVVVFCFVVVDAFTAVPIYEARTRLLIEAGNPNIVNFQEVVEEGQTRMDYYETQYNLLRSRALARRTMDELKLWAQPGAAPPQRGVRDVLFGWGSRLAATAQPARPPARVPDETDAQSAAIDGFLGGLTVLPVRNSRVVDVAYRSADPVLGSRIANALAKAYIEQNMEFRFVTSKEAADWLGARLAESRTQVETAENALQAYRERNQAVSLDDRDNIVVQRLTAISVAATKAKTDRIEKESEYNQLLAAQKNPAGLDAFAAILSNGLIQQEKSELATLQRQEAQLAERVGDKYPELIKVRSNIKSMQSRLQGDVAKIVQSVRQDFLAAQAQEQSLVGALEAQKREALAMNQKAIEYSVLRREAESARQIYDSLLHRAKETGVSSELRTSNIRIVDPAEVPRTPVSPNRRLSALRGLLFGLAAAFGLAFFLEYADNRIRRPDDVPAHLGIPVLGVVPAVKGTKGSLLPLVSNGASPAFMEALRATRTNVMFSSAQDGYRSLVVTSAQPGEGKTVIATNLAIALAQSGARVLLIDCDMRRPAVHERFGVQAEPGLSNLLVGTAKATDVAKQMKQPPGLWVMPAGRVPPNAAELLGSRRFRELIGKLGEHFQWVILDTPPVLAVTDASLAAHESSGVVFVIGADMLSRHSAKVAIEQLDRVGARIFGAVLNRVDFAKHAYYYSPHYRADYSAYYAHGKR